jgi:hypothetical protein
VNARGGQGFSQGTTISNRQCSRQQGAATVADAAKMAPIGASAHQLSLRSVSTIRFCNQIAKPAMAAAVAQLLLPAAGLSRSCGQRARLGPVCSVFRLSHAPQSGRRVAGGRPVGRGSLQVVAARVENEEVAIGTKAPDFEVSRVQNTGLQALNSFPCCGATAAATATCAVTAC